MCWKTTMTFRKSITMQALEREINTLLESIRRPQRAVVTAGMPYANGPLHLGHLAGVHIPADIYARWLRMLIGKENVLFVCGSDDHGSTSEIAARKEAADLPDFIQSIHTGQQKTLERYQISLDAYSGTSRPELKDLHFPYCQDFLRRLHDNNMLEKKLERQWFDTQFKMFLPDRLVQGTCPRCGDNGAWSEECDQCQARYPAEELLGPRSALGDASPVLKETWHWHLKMGALTDQLQEWLQGKQKVWHKSILTETLNTIAPTLSFSNRFESTYKEMKSRLPGHKSRYAPGKRIALRFPTTSDLAEGDRLLSAEGISTQAEDSWSERAITRDTSWGIPVPDDKDADMSGKTLYVWPESLIAPISFSRLALKKQGRSPEEYKKFWYSPESRAYQFLGQDNVFFYVLMQGALWLGTQSEPKRMPIEGELQLTEIFSNFHLQVDGAKMSKSRGNSYTGDQLLDEKNYHSDQIRHFLSILSLSEKNSNLDFEHFDRRNSFLAGPLNAALEKPISACHSKFQSQVPPGELMDKIPQETQKMVRNYLRLMEKAQYAKVLFLIENYARSINRLFTLYKPHDDRHDKQQRSNALYSSFTVLKNLLIMLHPFTPDTMERLRISLNLSPDIYSLNNLAAPFPVHHKIGPQNVYFPDHNLKNTPS